MLFLEISLEAWNFINKETLAQVFSCEFYEMSKNTFSYRTPPVVASTAFKDVLKKEKKSPIREYLQCSIL